MILTQTIGIMAPDSLLKSLTSLHFLHLKYLCFIIIKNLWKVPNFKPLISNQKSCPQTTKVLQIYVCPDEATSPRCTIVKRYSIKNMDSIIFLVGSCPKINEAGIYDPIFPSFSISCSFAAQDPEKGYVIEVNFKVENLFGCNCGTGDLYKGQQKIQLVLKWI